MGTIKNVTLKGITIRPTFRYYLHFMQERQNIWWKRFNNQPAPWTNDPILNEHKFTNVYRCLDRTSQYLLKEVIYNGKEYSKEEMVWRILLFKHFNKNETWDLLIKEFGDINSKIPVDTIDKYLVKCIEEHKTIYSNAYMVTGQIADRPEIKALNTKRKHSMYFYVFKEELLNGGIAKKITKSKSMEQLFTNILDMSAQGNFTAFQFANDINYSNVVNLKDDFVIAGPGAIRGIEKTFIDPMKIGYSNIIKFVKENIDELRRIFGDMFEKDYSFNAIPNLPFTLVSFQSCFCECDKYTRAVDDPTIDDMGQKRIKQKYTDKGHDSIIYTFPPKWKVDLIQPVSNKFKNLTVFDI